MCRVARVAKESMVNKRKEDEDEDGCVESMKKMKHALGE